MSTAQVVEVVDLARLARTAAHRRRVPVPEPATVALAEVLAEPVDGRGACPVRVVGGDGLGRLLERGETLVDVRQHELADPAHAVRVHPRDDVDEHERRCIETLLTHCHEAGAATH